MTKNLLLDPRRGRPSASMMYRLKECSGAFALAQWIKANGSFVPTNAAAAIGTRIHRWLALEIFAQNSADTYAKFARIDQSFSNGDRATAIKCTEIRNELLKAWNPAWTTYDKMTGFELMIEQRLWSEHMFSGQPDLIVIDEVEARAIVLNYKTGRIEAQAAADNMQLRTEAVLLHETRPDLTEIQGAIVEPLVSWDSERVSYDAEALSRAREEILSILDEANFHSAVRRAGPWCTYCEARLYCREALDYVTVPNLSVEKAIVELPRGEDGTRLWEKIKLAKKILADLETAYTRIMEEQGDSLPGYILPAQGHERRIVPYPTKLKEALAEYLSGDEVDGCAQFFLTKIKELLGLKYKINGKELDSLFNKLTRDAVSVAHDAPFIRPMTKKEREAIAETAP